MPPRRMHGSTDVSRSLRTRLWRRLAGGQGGASGDGAQSGIKLRAKREGNMTRNDAKASKGCVAEKNINTCEKRGLEGNSSVAVLEEMMNLMKCSHRSVCFGKALCGKDEGP